MALFLKGRCGEVQGQLETPSQAGSPQAPVRKDQEPGQHPRSSGLPVAATGNGRLAAEPAAGIGLREAPAILLGCRLRRSEAAALTMGRVERRDDAASRNGTPNRVARHARRNDGGKCGRRNGRRRRAARSACYPAALTAAPVGGRGAREGPRRAARWPRCTVAGARLPAGTASRAADSSDSSSASCLGAAIASRGGRAGTMVGKCGRPPRGAHPHSPVGSSDTERPAGAGSGRQASLSAKRQPFSWAGRAGPRPRRARWATSSGGVAGGDS